MEYKVIASDLDGTLLNNKKEVSAENLHAIEEMSRLGVYFVPCSGRTLGEIPSNVKDIPSVRYIIHSDGAVIHDKKTGARIESCMSKENAAKALDILFEYEVSMTVRYNGNSYVDSEHHTEENYIYHRVDEGYRGIIFNLDIPVENFKRFCYELDGIEMICIHFHSQNELMECWDRLKKIKEISVTQLEEPSIEIYDAKAGKGNALLRLAEHLGVNENATIGVGDSGNDLDMIKKAGLGLAMSNSLDITKKAADEMICSNEEHCAKYILEHYVLNK